MNRYDHKAIEKKWQQKWEKDGTYRTTNDSTRDKCFVLDMFPYPSGEGLHVGHPKGYIATDVYSRSKRMQGKNVLHPMGWDAFGLPAENYAIKNKVHPRIAVEKNIARFKEQLSIIGLDYDWSREINTTDPAYYKWTQWIFVQLFKKGLAYESNEPINWCPSCLTGLANEDLEDGKCERCGSVVEKKPMRQWVLNICKYAERLLEDIDTLNWPASIKESQRNWIGKSQGVNFKCKVKDLDIEVEMYNSVPQTYHAETFTVIAPEHPLVEKLVKGTKYEEEVMQFIESVQKKKQTDKFYAEKEMEGIFTGRYIENFADTGKDLPIWIASYVIADYGTGIVNASAHDARDFEFAKKFDIPLHPVMFPADKEHAERVRNLEEAYCKDPEGIMAEPEKFRGRKWGEVRDEVIDHIEEHGFGKRTTQYKLRDWVFSRQRYWGEPIPIIHCEKCGPVVVPEKDLPVVLPEVEHYEPTGTGESPLANIKEWVQTTCPECGGEGRRETNTMPQWAGSSWYYLRFMDPENTDALVGKEAENYWQPVDMYVGGAEHATRHLIYARFWHKFLFDIGVASSEEPFARLQHVGLIQAEDGRKMGKRYGNVINPDTIVDLYGADTLRLYEMFMGPFDQNVEWNTESIIGPRRFIERVVGLSKKVSDGVTESHVECEVHKAIKKVTEDIEGFRFNTAVATLMTLGNTLVEQDTISTEYYKIFLQLLAPFIPHITEELYQEYSEGESIHHSKWPVYDPAKIVEDTVTIAVQVNGKLRGTFEAPSDTTEADAIRIAQELPEARKWLEGKEVAKTIYVPNKLVSIVVKG